MTKETGADQKTFVTATGDIDAVALSERIRARIDEKMARGLYDDQEVAYLRDLTLAVTESQRDFTLLFDDVDARNRIFAALDQGWDVTRPVDTGSPRGGAVGSLVSLYKKLFQKFVQPTLNIQLARQAEFNANTLRALDKMKGAVESAERQFNNLSARMTGAMLRAERLESRMLAGEKRTDALERQAATLSSVMAEADREVIFMRRRVVELLNKLSSAPETLASATAEAQKFESLDYLLFENRHRGSRDDIRQKLAVYPGWFKNAPGPVVDVGCGRGELLELYREAGIGATGIDLNDEMVEECKQRGLAVEHADLLGWLGRQADGSLGGISAIQVIEHLPSNVMVDFFRAAYDKLAHGGTLACETVNPTSLATLSGPFYLDISHDKPVHPMAVQFLLQRCGFREVRIEWLNPFPDHMRLGRLAHDSGMPGWMKPVVEEYNRTAAILNMQLFGSQDYAVVAVK
ncbi:MAG: class I SAM-dependent methyltransferase [Nitrospinae bacterium]|nr:class I SAM-dependent methyltransferase [Nitrospinota bacterium]